LDQPPETMTERQRAFADELLKSQAVKFGAFRLKLHEKQPDAPLSPIYVDLRVLQSYPDALETAALALAEMIGSHELTFSRYAAIPMAATPLAAVLSHLSRVPMITPREAKTHGSAETINGAFMPGETVLVIDDVVSQADSKLESIAVLKDQGLIVRDVAVLVDREQGGSAQLARAGYRLHAVLRLSQLLVYWNSTGSLDTPTFRRVTNYFNNFNTFA
jgi:orotate phosphoribosyltransferase